MRCCDCLAAEVWNFLIRHSNLKEKFIISNSFPIGPNRGSQWAKTSLVGGEQDELSSSGERFLRKSNVDGNFER